MRGKFLRSVCFDARKALPSCIFPWFFLINLWLICGLVVALWSYRLLIITYHQNPHCLLRVSLGLNFPVSIPSEVSSFRKHFWTLCSYIPPLSLAKPLHHCPRSWEEELVACCSRSDTTDLWTACWAWTVPLSLLRLRHLAWNLVLWVSWKNIIGLLHLGKNFCPMNECQEEKESLYPSTVLVWNRGLLQHGVEGVGMRNVRDLPLLRDTVALGWELDWEESPVFPPRVDFPSHRA